LSILKLYSEKPNHLVEFRNIFAFLICMNLTCTDIDPRLQLVLKIVRFILLRLFSNYLIIRNRRLNAYNKQCIIIIFILWWYSPARILSVKTFRSSPYKYVLFTSVDILIAYYAVYLLLLFFITNEETYVTLVAVVDLCDFPIN